MARPRKIPKFQRRRDGVTNIRKDDYGDNWKELTAEVKKRDRYICRICGEGPRERKERGGLLEVDHIIPLGRGGTTTKRNLRAACDECHSKRRSSRRRTRASNKRRKRLRK